MPTTSPFSKTTWDRTSKEETMWVQQLQKFQIGKQLLGLGVMICRGNLRVRTLQYF